ncbi:hypothetical protein FSP39_014488 [Pinctada imbricata]|uniref:Tripartite motif-containing protein 2-like n=1 Tax=Pinctada imbricata TaxID=66713 RepID=A0AA88YD66_PINIB|nr:hypothetical protein FSP39_014488 [Pinctada imbricata]
MASSMEAQLDLTRCSICFEIFNLPKQLPCLHSFCEVCLQSYITEVFNKDSTNTKGIHCPICRAFIDKPDDQVFRDWGKTFPTNHLMNNIIDYTKSKNENESKYCNVCERENESKTASHWCVNCCDALCSPCERQHRRFKTTALHKLVEIGKMKDSESEGLLYGAEVFCEEHRSESVRFYCADHKRVCCMTCMMLRHRKCDDVGSVEDGAKATKTSKEIKELKTDLKGLKIQFEELVKNREENIQSFTANLAQTEDNIETSLNELTNHFKTTKTEILEELGAKKKEIIPQLQDEKSELECKVAGIANDLAIFESTSLHAPPAQYLQTVRSLLEQREKLETELNKQRGQLRNHNLEYKRNETLDTIKETANLLGTISVLQKDVPLGTDHVIEEEDDTNVGTRIELKNKIDVEGHVKGVDFVDDNRIIGSSGGKTLTLFHTNGTLINSVEFPKQVWSIWSVRMKNHQEGAVVVFNYLQFFKVLRNDIILTTDLELITMDFAFTDEKHIFIGRSGINILDDTLRPVRKIAVEHEVGYMDLRDVHSICYTVYCGDVLYCVDLDGKQLFSYTHEKLQKTTGVMVDSRGQIYVCGFKSRNIHQLNHEGQLQTIIFEDLPGPYCIRFNDKEDKVAIGCCQCVLLYDFC